MWRRLHLLCSHSLYWLPQLRWLSDIALPTPNAKPNNFDREMYWTAFVAVGAAAVISRIVSLEKNSQVRRMSPLHR